MTSSHQASASTMLAAASRPVAEWAEDAFQQGTQFLREGRYAEAEGWLRSSLGLRPDDPDTLNNLGTAIWQQGRVAEAEGCYRQAARLRPDDFAIQNNLGNALWRQGRLEEAAPCYELAITLNPTSAEVWMNLGVIQADLGLGEPAVTSIERSLTLRPGWPEALDNLGTAHARMGRWSTAKDYHEQALALSPNLPEAHRNRALALLKQGDYARGWPEYEWRLACRVHEGFSSPIPRWDGRERPGGVVLLHAEQGLGDTIQFLRYAVLVKRRVGRVVLFCHRSLVNLVAGCPGVDEVHDRIEDLPAFDAHCSLLSLPAILGTTLETIPGEIPYLVIDEPTRALWRSKVEAVSPRFSGPTLRIGVVWQGNPLNRVDRQRSFPLAAIEPLARVAGVRLVSLQKGVGVEQITRFRERAPLDLLSPIDRDDRDLVATAAAIQALDLIVAPDSGLAHLAGALGRPIWLASHQASDWRWLDGTDQTPWYPTMTLFRQTRPGDWASVFEPMAERLAGQLGG